MNWGERSNIIKISEAHLHVCASLIFIMLANSDPDFSSLDTNKAIVAPESQFGHEMIHRINTDVDLISRAYTIDLQDQALERYSPVRINHSIES